jgi:hypothetical protein
MESEEVRTSREPRDKQEIGNSVKRVCKKLKKGQPLCTTELVEPASVGEDQERHLHVAEHGELVSLLHQPALPLRERHLPADLVLDSLQLHLAPPHLLSLQNPNPLIFSGEDRIDS